MATKVEIHNEVRKASPKSWVLCFQRVTYHHDDGRRENGYRFIWRRPNGTLQAARGQARIPNAAIHARLIRDAQSQGWFK